LGEQLPKVCIAAGSCSWKRFLIRGSVAALCHKIIIFKSYFQIYRDTRPVTCVILALAHFQCFYAFSLLD